MDELRRLFLLIGALGLAMTALGVVSAWWMEEVRRLRRGLKRVLGAEPEAVLVAPGAGRAAGFYFSRGRMAVAWDGGSWGLAYRFEDLLGAEIVVDGKVAARVYRGEARRALDALADAQREVRLRLLFADVRWPDFDLALWPAGRRGDPEPKGAIDEANRWLARVEAIIRQGAPASAPAVSTSSKVQPADEAGWDDDPPF